MIKRLIILGALVPSLVALLLCCISPGEVRIAYYGARRKLRDAAVDVPHGSESRLRESHTVPAKTPIVRDLLPEAFRPYSPRPPSIFVIIWTWFPPHHE